MILRTFIVCFWIIMMALLVARDFWPQRETTIPLENAIQRMFDGGKQSRLSVFYRDVRVGDVQLTTQHQGEFPMALLEGGISVPWNNRYERWLFGARARLARTPKFTVLEGALWARMASRMRLYGSYAFNLKRDYHHVVFGALGFEPRIVDGSATEVRNKLVTLVDEWTHGALGAVVASVLDATRKAGQRDGPTVRAFTRRMPDHGHTHDLTEIQIVADEEVLGRLWLDEDGEVLRLELKGDYVLTSERGNPGLQ
jgi:hypothetical protein